MSDRTEISRKEYKKQRNFCVNLLKRPKREHFENLDINSISNNKQFWQIVKPLFSNKVKGKTTMKFVGNYEMIDNEMQIANLFNKYFVNIVKKLGLYTKEQGAISTENSLCKVEIAIEKYGNHPSIIAITEKMEKLGSPTFGFDFTSYEKLVKEVNNLKIRKVSQKADIPVRIIKENIDVVSYFLYHNFNNSLSCSTFPTTMKCAEVTPIMNNHKKNEKTDKENYHPISILPNLSKV